MNVGEPVDEDVKTLSGWAEAIDLEFESRDFLHEVSQDHAEHLFLIGKRSWWNERRNLAVAEFELEVDRRVADVEGLSDQQRENLRAAVRWWIIFACMESEYLDASPAGFYLPMMKWYIKGHFPCGWQGPYPRGRAVVF